jgi:GGDEF domain-containing protein
MLSIGGSVLVPAHFEANGLEASALIKSADCALYQSKNNGRNCSSQVDLMAQSGNIATA